MRRIEQNGEVMYEVNGNLMSEADYDAMLAQMKAENGAQSFGPETSWRKPLVSDGLAVHPLDVKAAQEYAQKHGVPTQFQKTGEPIFTSRKHRDKYLKTQTVMHRGRQVNIIDRNSYY